MLPLPLPLFATVLTSCLAPTMRVPGGTPLAIDGPPGRTGGEATRSMNAPSGGTSTVNCNPIKRPPDYRSERDRERECFFGYAPRRPTKDGLLFPFLSVTDSVTVTESTGKLAKAPGNGGNVTDSPAERKRRSRAHATGDHSGCSPSRCAALAVESTVETGEQGPIERAVAAMVASLRFPEGDPRAVLNVLALRYARLLDGPAATTAAGQELRHILVYLNDEPTRAADEVDELRARRHARRALTLLDGTG
jgi:hypothetical protein